MFQKLNENEEESPEMFYKDELSERENSHS